MTTPFRSLYFLNRFSNAARASRGLDVEVSRSIVVRGVKNEHSFRASFFGIRAVIGLVHSNRLAVSKNVHCRQLCSSAPQLGHFPCSSMPAGRTVAQEAHRHTERCPGIVGVLGPKSQAFAPASVRGPRNKSPCSPAVYTSCSLRNLGLSKYGNLFKPAPDFIIGPLRGHRYKIVAQAHQTRSSSDRIIP